MTLRYNSFTGKNIESILTSGKTVDTLTQHETPLLIIKLGPPGSGKSSEHTANIIRDLGVDPSDALVSDIDSVFASFRDFRNATRRVRNNYRRRSFNANFYRRLSNIHVNTKGVTNIAQQKTIKRHMDGMLSKAIRSKKNIVLESVAPISWIFSNFETLLRVNNYSIYILFHTLSIPALIERIHARGEQLYALENSYYRAFDPERLQAVVNDLYENLNTVLMPKFQTGVIKNIHFITNE